MIGVAGVLLISLSWIRYVLLYLFIYKHPEKLKQYSVCVAFGINSVNGFISFVAEIIMIIYAVNSFKSSIVRALIIVLAVFFLFFSVVGTIMTSLGIFLS